MDDNRTNLRTGFDPRPNYAFSGRIMLISVIVLFVACILIAFLHTYTRWFLHRRIRLRIRRFAMRYNAISAAARQSGLDESVIKSLPTFLYSSESHDAPLDCAVCLSEFDSGEIGRLLPKCGHCFHVDCIDMWFYSHSTCPLCRAPVQPAENPAQPALEITVNEQPGSTNEPGSGQEGRSSSSAAAAPPLDDRSKPQELIGIIVETPVTVQDGIVQPELVQDKKDVTSVETVI